MYKVDEKVDLSKKVLGIDINSEAFQCMLKDMNSEIQRCILNVFDEKFEAGEITLKLNIELPKAYENFPSVDIEGEPTVKTFKYRKPVFDHKITTTLKKQYKRDGGYTDKRDIQLKDGKFIAVPIKEAQMNIDDLQ